jgi:hypothetical protein
MHYHLKKLLIVTSLLIPTVGFCQSNDKATVQLGIGSWLTVGNAIVKNYFDNSQNVKGSGIGVKGSFGIMGQYGFSEKVSGGIFLKRESAIYSTSYTYDDKNFTPPATDLTTAGFSYGAELKYYIDNKNSYNFYVSSQFGFYTGDATLKVYSADGNLNGIVYGAGGGINWYWGYNVGMSMDFGIHGQSLEGSPHNPADFDYFPERVTSYKTNGLGIYFGLGINIKFDRESTSSIL